MSGLFYATTHWGNYDRLNDAQFERFSRPFDLRLLKLAQSCPFNVLHVCKSNNMLEKLSDYPVHAFNWTRQTTPILTFQKVWRLLKTGLLSAALITRKPWNSPNTDLVITQAGKALDQTRGRDGSLRRLHLFAGGAVGKPKSPAGMGEQVPVKS